MMRKFLTHSGYFVVNKLMVQALGVNAALLLSDLADRYDYFLNSERLDEEGYFYCTGADMERTLPIGRKVRETAMQLLCDKGLISIVKKGMPAKNYFRLEEDAVCTFVQTCMSQMDKQVCPKRTNMNAPTGQTNTTISKEQNLNTNNSGDSSPELTTDFENLKEWKKVVRVFFITRWFEEYEKKNGVQPHFAARDGKVINQLVDALRVLLKPKYETEEKLANGVMNTFDFILVNWDKQPKWYQDNFSLTTMYSKLNEIINFFRNANSKTSGTGNSGDSLNSQLDKFYNGRERGGDKAEGV